LALKAALQFAPFDKPLYALPGRTFLATETIDNASLAVETAVLSHFDGQSLSFHTPPPPPFSFFFPSPIFVIMAPFLLHKQMVFF
jgi:hypothetical protein